MIFGRRRRTCSLLGINTGQIEPLKSGTRGKKTEMSVRVMIRTKSGIRRNGEMKWGELTVEWGRRLEVMRRLAGRDCWRSKMWKKPAIQPPMCLSICFSRFWSCTIPVIISSSCFSPFASLSTSSVVNE